MTELTGLQTVRKGQILLTWSILSKSLAEVGVEEFDDDAIVGFALFAGCGR